MKNLVLAAFAALSLTAAIVPVANAASTIAGDAQATRMQQTGSYGGQ
jgi:sarcosine oxidase gamma subunit